MDIKDKRIDGGKAFDWGRTSSDYARYRDIYPDEFYRKIAELGLCIKGQRVLDIGTGTGVLPRNMYSLGADWTGTDISPEQIASAEQMSKLAGMNIRYSVSSAESLPFEDGSFDVITACQCYWYFDHKRTAPLFSRLLSDNGRLLLIMMNWLPFEDELAMKSEQLVLKYNPDWTGAGDRFKQLVIPEEYLTQFSVSETGEYRLPVRFTRESWNGRIKACRGIGASLPQDRIEEWEKEHLKMLEAYPEEFDILHYAAYAVLDKKQNNYE